MSVLDRGGTLSKVAIGSAQECAVDFCHAQLKRTLFLFKLGKYNKYLLFCPCFGVSVPVLSPRGLRLPCPQSTKNRLQALNLDDDGFKVSSYARGVKQAILLYLSYCIENSV